MVLLWLPWFFFSTKTFQSVKVSLFLNNSLQSNDFIKGNYFACIHFFLAAQLTWVQISLSEMFHHKCFHLRVKIDYAVWSVERGEVLIGTVIGDCDSRFDNLSEILHQSEYINCCNLTTANSRLQTPLARMTGCVPFSQSWSIFFAQGGGSWGILDVTR